MECVRPLIALDFGVNPDTKKHKLKILPKRVDSSISSLKEKYGDSSVVLLPCGKCLPCRMNYANSWGVKCLLESLYHRQSSFVTLTFSDEHLPSSVQDLKREFQLFIKRLRGRGFKCRYFGCGERGETGDRFHLHIILFGVWLDDFKYRCQSGGIAHYSSLTLQDLWNNQGIVDIEPFCFQNARYTASYCVRSEKKTAFVLCSKKPPIGYQYFLDHKNEIYEFDKIYGNFGNSYSVKPPRSFDQWCEKIDFDIRKIKESRSNLSKIIKNQELISSSVSYEDLLLRLKAETLKSKMNRR